MLTHQIMQSYFMFSFFFLNFWSLCVTHPPSHFRPPLRCAFPPVLFCRARMRSTSAFITLSHSQYIQSFVALCLCQFVLTLCLAVQPCFVVCMSPCFLFLFFIPTLANLLLPIFNLFISLFYPHISLLKVKAKGAYFFSLEKSMQVAKTNVNLFLWTLSL